MSIPVPYLSDEVIERDAAALLAEYAQARGTAIIPSVPIENIVEKHLKIGKGVAESQKKMTYQRRVLF